MDSKEKKQLIDFLRKYNLMTLATNDSRPWVATVYYAVDEDLNLYFVSSPKSKHCKDIKKDDQVACAIYDSHTKNTDKKAGIQLQGKAMMVDGWKNIRLALEKWHKAAPGAEEKINVERMKANELSSRIYKIVPSYIKFFNQKLYPQESVREWKI